MGCLRTVEEIQAWGSMDEEGRRQLICLVEQRQVESLSFQ